MPIKSERKRMIARERKDNVQRRCDQISHSFLTLWALTFGLLQFAHLLFMVSFFGEKMTPIMGRGFEA